MKKDMRTIVILLFCIFTVLLMNMFLLSEISYNIKNLTIVQTTPEFAEVD